MIGWSIVIALYLILGLWLSFAAAMRHGDVKVKDIPLVLILTFIWGPAIILYYIWKLIKFLYGNLDFVLIKKKN